LATWEAYKAKNIFSQIHSICYTKLEKLPAKKQCCVSSVIMVHLILIESV